MKHVKPIVLSSSLFLALSALLVACGDDGGSSSGPVGARHLASIDDAGPCNAKNDEETVLVGEEKEPWWCDASTGTWTRLGGDDGDSSEEGSSGKLSSADDESSSSGKSGGKSSKKSSSSSSSSSSYKEVFFDCTGKTARSGKQTMTVMVDTVRRSFVMNVPAAYDGSKAVPLIVDYHAPGGSGAGAYALDSAYYRPYTEPEGVITLYPDGTSGGTWGPDWNVGPCCSHSDDTLFTRIMIDSVKARACIDTTRIYAKSFSHTGMAHHVACFMSEIFAAVAPAAGDLNTTNSARCNPTRPISVIMFRGKKDNVVRYEGKDSGYGDGLNFLGAERNFLFWAEKNHCTDSATTNADGCREYSSCEGGTKVVLCADERGGHEPGDGAIGWPFLKQFRLP